MDSPVQAIGFDLFDTLITVQNLGFHDALERLLRSLQQDGLRLEAETFLPAYREAVRQFRDTVQRDGRETHNRFWISAALHSLGHAVAPDDQRVWRAVEAYFAAFLEHAVVLPDTLETLVALRERYRLGLLSNFTHGPAVHAILARLGIASFLEVIVISGEVGYRKPHRYVFDQLSGRFGIAPHTILFVGDDLEADVHGAHRAGLRPVWTTCARAYKTPPREALPEGDDLPPFATMIRSWADLLRLLDAA